MNLRFAALVAICPELQWLKAADVIYYRRLDAGDKDGGREWRNISTYIDYKYLGDLRFKDYKNIAIQEWREESRAIAEALGPWDMESDYEKYPKPPKGS